MTKPAKLKFTIYQGATFRKRLTWPEAGAHPHRPDGVHRPHAGQSITMMIDDGSRCRPALKMWSRCCQ